MAHKYWYINKWNYEEFEAVYEPQDATAWLDSRGATVLQLALRNRVPATLVAITNRLLDDGADATLITRSEQVNVLHLLFSQKRHDFALEVPLVGRLLDSGADLNWVSPVWGTPLQILNGQGKFSDAELAPFYDVIFARPEVDLLKPGERGWSSLESVRRAGPRRSDLRERMEAYLTQHGQAVPAAG
jgi:hypothetical protein